MWVGDGLGPGTLKPVSPQGTAPSCPSPRWLMAHRARAGLGGSCAPVQSGLGLTLLSPPQGRPQQGAQWGLADE